MTATHQTNGTKYFTDLPALVVGGFQPAPGPGAGWFPFQYELDQFAGVGLTTGAFSPAGELVLDLGLTGWHRLRMAHNPALRYWLDGEAGYCEVPGDASGISAVAVPAAFGQTPKAVSRWSMPSSSAACCDTVRGRRGRAGRCRARLGPSRIRRSRDRSRCDG